MDAVIVLHEIYGLNSFISDVKNSLEQMGFAVFCPNMLGRKAFAYADSKEAYSFFKENVGFGVSKNVSELVTELNARYDRVYVLGFSAGATVAWLCGENPDCAGIICCYGSRIRDFTEIEPACPNLLIFAEEDSFSADALTAALENKPHTVIHKISARHGFLDKYGENYDENAAVQAKKYIDDFLSQGGILSQKETLLKK